MCIVLELRLILLLLCGCVCCDCARKMPLKKRGEQARSDEQGAEEVEGTVSPPLMPGAADSIAFITADMLQQILYSSQQAMIAEQKVLQAERMEHAKAMAIEHARALAETEEKSRTAHRQVLAESQHALAENQRILLKDNKEAIAAIVAALPGAPVLTHKKVKIEVPRWQEGESMHEYLLKYEKAQTNNGVDKRQWGVLLQVFLSGSAQAAYTQIDPELVDDYDSVKGMMLKVMRDTPEQADRNWWSLARKQGETMSAFQIRLKGVATRRFQGCDTREALFDKVVLSRLLYLLPADQYNLVTMRNPESAAAVADIVDDLECRAEFSKMHLSGGRQSQGGQPYYKKDNHYRNNYGYRGSGNQGSNTGTGSNTQPPSAPNVVVSSPETAVKSKVAVSNPNPTQAGNKGGSSSQTYRGKPVICYACREPGHIKPNCPNRVRRLSPCEEEDSDEEDMAEPTWVDGWVGSQAIKGMRFDSGCDRTVVAKHLVPAEAYLGQQVTLKGWRGKQTSVHELARVDIKVSEVIHKRKKVAVAEEMEYPALLGADMSRAVRGAIMKRVMEEWEGEPQVAGQSMEAKSSDAVRLTRAERKKEQEEEEANVVALQESGSSPIPLEDIFDFQEDLFEDFGVATPLAELGPSPEMGVDSSLTSHNIDSEALAKEQVEDPTLKPLLLAAEAGEKGYRIEKGVLVQGEVDELGEETCRVVPKGRRQALLALAHSGLVSGHFGVKKTYAKLSAHFIWPKMWVEVKAHVRTCGGCQRAARNSNAKAPLTPLPCIGVPFKLVAFDLVGPLTKSVGGHRFILTMMDYYTKYPEAIALKRVDNQSVLEAMLEIFSRHGIPECILTDQGSVFMSRLTKAVCNTLGVEQIRTSPYHPQSDGALERWHSCLKGMLKKSEADLKYWDRHLKYLLFAYRDTPHTVTGFSPFSLLFGREVKGPLSLVQESWLEGESEGVEAGEWLATLKQQMAVMADVVSKREKLAKAKMKIAYDKSAREKSFEIGDLVLIRKPGIQGKFGDSWGGPFEVLQKISTLNYRVQAPGVASKSKVLHVNLMKKWSTPEARIHGIAVVHEEEGERESPPGVVLSREGFVPTAEQQLLLDQTLATYDKVLCDTPGKTNRVSLAINTGDASPVRSHPYRIPPRWKDEVKAQIDQLLNLGIIQASDSPWSSAVVTVRKKDGGVRICVDYRGVNGVTAPDPYQMPFIEDILDTLASAKFLSKIDLNKGFHQIPVNKADMHKTAFCTPWGKFQFARMPFGLRNGPAVFQRLMDSLLHKDLEYSRVYIDDIVVFSTTWEQHCWHLGQVLERLHQAGLTVNRKKCQWGCVKLEFLGHLVGEGQVSPSECKVLALRDYPQPVTKKGVQQFLGLAGYYRKYIQGYASHSIALTDATRKSAPDRVVWCNDMLNEFVYLKCVLCDVPSLTLPTIQDEFLLQTDASGRGVGAILSVRREGQEYPVAYFSRKLKDREQRYSATELEGLAVVAAVQHFDSYLVSHPFTIETDHRALIFMNSSRHTNGRLARWALALQPYTFVISYRTGSSNANADVLSRCFEEEPATVTILTQEEGSSPSKRGGEML